MEPLYIFAGYSYPKNNGILFLKSMFVHRNYVIEFIFFLLLLGRRAGSKVGNGFGMGVRYIRVSLDCYEFVPNKNRVGVFGSTSDLGRL